MFRSLELICYLGFLPVRHAGVIWCLEFGILLITSKTEDSEFADKQMREPSSPTLSAVADYVGRRPKVILNRRSLFDIHLFSANAIRKVKIPEAVY